MGFDSDSFVGCLLLMTTYSFTCFEGKLSIINNDESQKHKEEKAAASKDERLIISMTRASLKPPT